ncbi:transposase family protein [Pandoraea sputorum]|uniref:transposase family protein n=1 Tax=Pandoraea sputorum TaxID=93222 RepID=UPI00177E84A0
MLLSFAQQKRNSEVLSIEDAVGDLSDPRSRTPVHGLTEMLLVALCAVLAGADSGSGIELWGQAKLDWLRGCIFR